MVGNDIFLWCPCKQNALFHKIYTPLPIKKQPHPYPQCPEKGLLMSKMVLSQLGEFIVEGKKEFLENLFLVLRLDILST